MNLSQDANKVPEKVPKKKTFFTSKERITLIHKGNYLFNQKKYLVAEKIFRSVLYQDGLIRLAQHYFHLKNYFRAIGLFRLAKYIKGEYICYQKLGFLDKSLTFGKKEDYEKADKQINKKIAFVISKVMKEDL